MRYGRWISSAAALVVVGGLAAGCASEEPREVGRAEDSTLAGGQVQRDGLEGGEMKFEEIDEDMASHLLDGKTFSVELRGPEGKVISDDLLFRDGEFDSLACHQYGYSSAPYIALEGADGGITFRSITSSDQGKMRWNGTVRGDQIEGTAVVNEPGKEPVYFSYSGSTLDRPQGAGSVSGQDQHGQGQELQDEGALQGK